MNPLWMALALVCVALGLHSLRRAALAIRVDDTRFVAPRVQAAKGRAR